MCVYNIIDGTVITLIRDSESLTGDFINPPGLSIRLVSLKIVAPLFYAIYIISIRPTTFELIRYANGSCGFQEILATSLKVKTALLKEERHVAHAFGKIRGCG